MCKTEYPTPDCFTVSFFAAELSLCYLFQCWFLTILSCFPKASFSFPCLPYLCFSHSDWLYGSCWEDIALLCTSAVMDSLTAAMVTGQGCRASRFLHRCRRMQESFLSWSLFCFKFSNINNSWGLAKLKSTKYSFFPQRTRNQGGNS